MPGVTDRDVTVALKDGMLTIEGTASTAGYDKLAPLYTEYNVGNYFRQFALNSEVDEARISAKMRNGVLTVDLPKHERPSRALSQSQLADPLSPSGSVTLARDCRAKGPVAHSRITQSRSQPLIRAGSIPKVPIWHSCCGNAD